MDLSLGSWISTPPFMRPVPALLLMLSLTEATLPRTAEAQDPTSSQQAQANLPPVVLADQAAYTLAFDHTSGVIELRNHRGVVQERWETRGVARPTAPLAQIPPDRPLVVVIENANSLLYEYDVSVDVIGQKQISSCSNIGGQFASRAFMVSVGALQGITSPPPPGSSLGFNQPFLDFQAMGNARGVGEARGAATLTSEALERSLGRVRREVESYLRFTDQVEELSETLPHTIRATALLAESRPIDSLLAGLQESIEGLARGLSDPSGVADVLRDRSEAVTSSAQALETLFGQVTRGGYVGSYQDQGAVEVRTLRSRLETASGALMDSHRVLQEELLRIEKARARSTQGFSAGPSRGTYRRVTIRLSGTTDPAGAAGIRTGDLMVYTEPHVGMACYFSVGFGIVDRPTEYDVNDGQLVDSTQDDLRTAANVLFHVGPVALPVSLMFGAGFGVERAPDLFLGGTLRFFHPVLMNAGIAWQRQRVLGAGMELGATMPPSFRIEDLDTKYRSSFFVGLSITP